MKLKIKDGCKAEKKTTMKVAHHVRSASMGFNYPIRGSLDTRLPSERLAPGRRVW